jgi:hypothetical protein
MKAIIKDRCGSPDALELTEIDPPATGDDEVLVRFERRRRRRRLACHDRSAVFLRILGSGLRKPMNRVPGTDVAGYVESVRTKVTRSGRATRSSVRASSGTCGATAAPSPSSRPSWNTGSKGSRPTSRSKRLPTTRSGRPPSSGAVRGRQMNFVRRSHVLEVEARGRGCRPAGCGRLISGRTDCGSFGVGYG